MKELTKDMYDPELQPYYHIPGRMLARLLYKKWGIYLFSLGEKLLQGRSMKGFDCEERYIPSTSSKGHKIRVRLFKPQKVKGKLPAMLYLHGGGYMVGNPEQYFATYRQYFDQRPFVLVAPDYRKSVKHPFPAGFNDSYDTLLWMKENAEQLHLLPDQFIVAGHSAGGGLTAAIALKARDTKQVNIAFQMPIYPMIDHRQITPSSQNMKKAPIWDSNNTKIAWDYYLRDLRENNKAIPPYASPSLNDHYEGLPPTITFVGDLEPFRDETIAYVEALKMAGIPVKFKLFKRAFHSFEIAASNSQMAKEANRFLFDAFGEYYDKYIIFG